MDYFIIDLCSKMFDWAKFGRTKGAIKLHILLDHDGDLPCFALITEGKRYDVKAVYLFQFDLGTIMVNDRDYDDYRLLGRLTSQGVYLVTRMKENALYEEEVLF